MKTRTEKQHYIPNKSYLEYFTDRTLKPPKLWVYTDKQQVFTDASTAIPKNITPINLCKESYLYETPRLPVNAIEKTFARIESNYKHVLDTKIIPRKKLSREDRLKIAYFLSTLEVRTPLTKEHIQNFLNEVKEKVQHLEEQFDQGNKSQLHKELDDMEEQNISFANMQIVALDVNRYGHSDYLFLVPQFDDDQAFFITSDFPVAMTDFTAMNSFYPPTPMDSTAETVIPLTPKIALLVNNIGLNGYREIDYNFIREVNNRVLKRSNKFIISPQKLDDKFTDYNVRRASQSFLLLFLSDKLRERRHKKIEKMLRQRTTQLVNGLVNAGIKMCSTHIHEKNLAVDYVAFFTQDKGEYEWLVKNIEEIGTKFQETPTGFIYKIKNPIKTKAGLLSFIKIRIPDPQHSQAGYVDFKVDNYSTFKNKYINKSGFSLVDKKKYELVELRDEKFNVLVYFPNETLTESIEKNNQL